jgi:tetratricopeptide (TPR) repeat protein
VTEQAAGPFWEQLIQALEHLGDPEWLGTNSPLAAPYFLGKHLLREPKYAHTTVGRGHALRAVIHDAAQTLAQQEGDYHDIIHLTYFRHQSVVKICHKLNISRATYYRYRQQAIKQLESSLVNHVAPALHLEQAPHSRPQLWEREEAIERCRSVLKSGKAVAITGGGGVGKTALGAFLANEWESQPAYWFTFRPGLNDQLISLFFSMGYFWHLQGASTLWLQLLASAASETGRTAGNETFLALVRHSLMNSKATPQLFCFDDVDLLHPQEVERHAQIFAFLQSLTALTPVILMGQQIPSAVDWEETVTGLSAENTHRILEKSNINLSMDDLDLKKVHTYTQGNPRLLELFIMLHRSGEAITDVLQRLSSAPSVEFMMSRIWKLMDKDEQDLLAALSTFRRPAPSDAWKDQGTLGRLTERNFVHHNSYGGVEITPVLKTTIYNTLAPEVKEAKHLQAAEVRAERGQYTSAAYHYIGGGEVEKAIWLWYMHRRQEINQGEGITALRLFEALSTSYLSEPVREILVLLRSELRMLEGDYTKTKNDLQGILWQTPLLKGRARRIAGDIAYERSQFDRSIRAYKEGLESLTSVDNEMALLYKEMGKVYEQRRDLNEAWRMSLLAEYEVENLKGNVQSDIGNYAEAHAYYEKALALAQQLGHTEGEGKTRNNLAWMLKQQGNIELAQQHWTKASECYTKIGNLIWQAGIKINQAVAYTETNQVQEAIPLLEEALSVFETLAHPRGKAKANANLAEAYLRLQNYEQAAFFAWRSLEDEEPSVMAAGFHTLAEISLAQEDFSQVKIFCQKSLDWAEKTSDTINAGFAWRTLGKLYQKQGRFNETKDALHKAITHFQNVDMEQEVEIAQAILRQIPTY